MALVACPQCGSQVSSDAAVCPQCGGRRRPADIVTAHATKSDSIVRWFGYSILGIVALVVLALFAHSFAPAERSVRRHRRMNSASRIGRNVPTTPRSCAATRGGSMCRSRAGSPRSKQRNTAPRRGLLCRFSPSTKERLTSNSGLVVAIEPDAKFQNAVGTMVRSRVACTYDLRAQRVVNVVVSES